MGLGNPGAAYAETRHNAGFWLADHLREAWGFDRFRREGQARVAGGVHHGEPLLLLEPLTYMNRSGAALAPLLARADFVPTRDVLILVDDVALPVGAFRLRKTGSAGGHNGLKDVEDTLGSREYARLRIGMGPVPVGVEDLADFVLAPCEPEERAQVDALLGTMAEAADCWVREGIDVAMNRFNQSRTTE